MDKLNERLLKLADLGETLVSERKFYLGQKNWPAVAARNMALRQHAEKVATVRHLIGLTSRH
jgi:hypothetical protein